ncbi:hypothetical protein [Streptomyces sp. NPDC004721]
MAFMLCQLHVAGPEHPLPDGLTAVYTEFTDLFHENTSNGAGRAETLNPGTTVVSRPSSAVVSRSASWEACRAWV